MEGNEGLAPAVAAQLAARYPTPAHAVAEAALLAAELTLPRPTVHILSDVHGENVKLRHVINNASGTLRPIVEQLFAGRLSAEDRQRLLTLLFYPRETLEAMGAELADPHDPGRRRAFFARSLGQVLEVARHLARQRTQRQVAALSPEPLGPLLAEILHADEARLGPAYVEAVLDALATQGQEVAFLRAVVRLARNLAVHEIVVAGDCFDRGPRADEVVELLTKQPRVSFVYGNHDAAWIGACLGSEACIAHVLRISLRYRRLSQLEEGYGITMQPLEHLARTAYGDDPADGWQGKGTGLREPLQIARMHKAAAILQFKLEGQLMARRPEWGLEARRLLHRIDPAAGTLTVDGTTYALRDTRLPTVDWRDPYALSVEEQACIARTRTSFLRSERLWEHVRWIADRGRMWLSRDSHLVFHACVPVDAQGRFLPLVVDGVPRAGRALFSAFERVIARAVRDRRPEDVDWLWYLWCGPLSPLFGKDRITTIERDFIADERAWKETKNPYFALIHDRAFCARVLAEFGCDPGRGLIVNGHVPVAVDKGESPLKRSGRAVTIDGAFSEAYGDHGYTLVMEPARTLLALHHHFDSVEAAVRDGVDIIPTVTVLREEPQPRRVGDTERGEALRAEIALLGQLASAAAAGDPGPAR